VVRARPVKVTPVVARARELIQAQAAAAAQALAAALGVRTKAVMAARVLHLQLPARQLPAAVVAVVTILTARLVLAVQVAVVEVLNTLMGQAPLAVQLILVVEAVVEAVEAVAQAAAGQGFLLSATSAHNA
jgi:hypothetical protein